MRIVSIASVLVNAAADTTPNTGRPLCPECGAPIDDCATQCETCWAHESADADRFRDEMEETTGGSWFEDEPDLAAMPF
jgi:hypothetical protein